MWLVLANFKMRRVIKMMVVMIKTMTMMIKTMVMIIKMGHMLIFSTPKWPKLNFRDPPLFFPVDTEERMQEDRATQTGGM